MRESNQIRFVVMHRILWRNLFCLAVLFYATLAHARIQDDSEPSILKRAVERMISPNESDRQESESALKGIRNPQYAELAKCALAVLHFHSDRPAEFLETVQLIQSRSKLPDSLEFLIAKLELCASVILNKGEIAEAKFKDVVRLAINEKADPALRRKAIELSAELCEYLMPLDQDSPISTDTLRKGHHAIAKLNHSVLANSRRIAAAKAQKSVDEIRKWFSKLEPMTEPERDELVDKIGEELADLEQQLDDAQAAAAKAAANDKETKRSNIVGSRKLQSEVMKIGSEPMAGGHPGNPPTPPRKPNRSSIRVDEYKTVRDKDGKEKKERRDSSDIEREKDREYKRLLGEYETALKAYLIAKNIYDQQLADWNQREKLRKSEQQERLDKINDSAIESAKQLGDSQENRKLAATEFQSLLAKTKEKRVEFRYAELVNRSFRQNVSAYCLICEDAVSIANEIPVLTKSIASINDNLNSP